MSRTKKAGVALAALVGAVVLIAIPAAASGPGQTVNVPSTLKISAYGYKGKVTSGNSNCVAERSVVLKQKGHGVLGRDKSEDNGSWEVRPRRPPLQGPAPLQDLRRSEAADPGHRRPDLQVPGGDLEDDRNRRRLGGTLRSYRAISHQS